MDYPVREGCSKYDFTVEQIEQKKEKRARMVRVCVRTCAYMCVCACVCACACVCVHVRGDVEMSFVCVGCLVLL